MRKYGVSYTNKRNINQANNNMSKEKQEIKSVLEILNEAYQKKDPDKVDECLNSLFINDDSLYALGTSSDELCPGVEEVRDLLDSDWKYWGDVNFKLDDSIINFDGDIAWFATPATVKYSYEHNQERYDKQLAFTKEKANDKSITAEERIAHINWALALTYHQQELEKRNYFCEMRFTGVMIKSDNEWKIAQGQFSMPKGVFADQRFESGQDFLDEYELDKKALVKYRRDDLDVNVESLLKNFEKDCIGHKETDLSHVNKYFSKENTPHIISPDTEWYIGKDSIVDFLNECSSSEMNLDTKSAITRTHGKKTWVTGIGTIKQVITREELANRALEAFNDIYNSDKTSQEKLFNTHRQVAYALKEGSAGESFTCPIRYSVMINHEVDNLSFEQMHFSYPFYWIFEGKLDTI